MKERWADRIKQTAIINAFRALADLAQCVHASGYYTHPYSNSVNYLSAYSFHNTQYEISLIFGSYPELCLGSGYIYCKALGIKTSLAGRRMSCGRVLNRGLCHFSWIDGGMQA